jgi:NADH-quinone oxidoreductase subunit L
MFFSEVAAAGPSFYALVPGIVLIPLLGMLINIFFGGRLGERTVGTIASLASGAAFVISVLLAISVAADHHGDIVHLAPWIHIGDLTLDWAFRVDSLSVVMMLVVSGVGTLIHIYSIGYMHEDVRHKGDPSRFRRFFVFLNLFIAMMMILVSADNYLMLFVGWEGVGLSSYLLIGFWYDKGENGTGNAMAAKKAFVTNRVGDFGFLLAVFAIFWAFGSLQFDEVFANLGSASPGLLFAISMFLMLGVAGKSAQIPLYVWLPDAMAGPTPVSALIHAATMVTAGVYLISRSYLIFAASPEAQAIIAIIGGATALLGALIAVGQFDIKRVLAYSTISQLGFMVAAAGMGAIVPAMFHLVTHAFFKALLFLSSGSVIQGMEAGEHHVHHDPHLKRQMKHTPGHHFDPQDMRNMGGLRTRMKTTFWVYLIGAMALAGIPPLAGFWSKDEILLEATVLQPTVFWMLMIAAFFTAFYMTRQIIMVFFGKPRTLPAEHAVESPPVMTVPLIVLAVLSVIGGFMNLPGTHVFGHFLETTVHAELAGVFTPLNAGLLTVPAIVAIGFSFWIYYIYGPRLEKLPAARRPDDPLRGWAVTRPFFRMFEKKFWVDEGYWALILNPYIALSKFLADRVDWQFWHDWFHDTVIVGGFNLISRLLSVQIDLGVIDRTANGLAQGVGGAAGALRRLQTGFVRNYALAVLLGVVVILGYLIFR